MSSHHHSRAPLAPHNKKTMPRRLDPRHSKTYSHCIPRTKHHHNTPKPQSCPPPESQPCAPRSAPQPAESRSRPRAVSRALTTPPTAPSAAAIRREVQSGTRARPRSPMGRTGAGAPPRTRASRESEPTRAPPRIKQLTEYGFFEQTHGRRSACPWWHILNVHGEAREGGRRGLQDGSRRRGQAPGAALSVRILSV